MTDRQYQALAYAVGALDLRRKKDPECGRASDELTLAFGTKEQRAQVSAATRTLTYAELSTILAALRTIQRKGLDWQEGEIVGDDLLGDDEIDSLCERLNCGQIVTITGGPKE